MNFKTTVVLIVILAAVGGYLFYTRDQGTKTETTETEQKKLIDVTVPNVTKLTVTSSDGKKIVLEKSGVLWQMLDPVKATADTFEVDSLIRTIAELQARGSTKITTDKASNI